MDNKPEYLYHGSQYKLDMLIPQQARGECDLESRLAIYAAATIDEVIPFALPIRWYPDTPNGKRSFSCSNGKTNLIYGSLNPNGIGYVYKIKSDSFNKIDQWQWISTEVCCPIEIFEIKVHDYLHTIKFSKEAEKICNELYGN
jgi:hypothetical protein